MKRINSAKLHSLCVQPTFIIGTYGENGVANFAPITWVSATWDTDQYLLVISMFGTKKTKENIAKNGMLSANIVSTDMLDLLDYFGSCSGTDGEKSAIPFDYEDGAVLHIPTLNKSKWVYECKVSRQIQTVAITTVGSFTLTLLRVIPKPSRATANGARFTAADVKGSLLEAIRGTSRCFLAADTSHITTTKSISCFLKITKSLAVLAK